MDFGSAFKFTTKHTPADPFTLSVLRSFYEFSRFSSQIKAVDEQTRDLLSTTYHVAFNVKEARRLQRMKAALLDPSESNWMDSVIRDTDSALFDIAKLVEPARIDLSVRKSVEFHNKVNWVFKQHIKVAEKHTRLTTCHQSLMAVISSLNLKTVKPEIETISEEYPWPHDPQMQRFLDSQYQRNRRRSIMSLRSEGSSAGSRSSMSSASIMTKATSNRNSGSNTIDTVESLSLLSLPEFEVLDLGSSHGDNKSSTDFTPPFVSSVGKSSPTPSPVVSNVDSDTNPSDVKKESNFGSPKDYLSVPEHVETSTHASIGLTQAADTAHNTANERDDEDKIISTTISLSPPSYPGADGLQVYYPYTPYRPPHFLSPLHTRASTSSFIDHPSTTNISPQNSRSSPNPTEKITGSSAALDHYPRLHESQQQMRRACSDSSHAPELYRASSVAGLAVSEVDQLSMSAGRGGACRAKRSWLMLHASRANSGHGIGWQSG